MDGLEAVRVDNVDLPFEMDEDILGKWEFAGFVSSKDTFSLVAVAEPDTPHLISAEFMPDGSVVMKTSDPTIIATVYTWTKGHILNVVDQTCSAYEFREIDGVKYLIFEWKSGDYIYRGMDPWYYVMKREEAV
jgi:bla regulator protein BlaR1